LIRPTPLVLANQTRPDYIYPMNILTITEAKAKLSGIIAQIEKTQEAVIIGRNGKPAVKIVPFKPERNVRRLGIFAGKIKMQPDWDKWPEDLAKSLGMKD
jgi:prevent-host-death family protein